MKFVHFLFVALSLFCIVPSAFANIQGCIDPSTYDPNVDYFPDKSTNNIAIYFSISYNNSFKIVQNTLTKEQFVLYQCGTPIPDASLFVNTTKFFSVPVQSVWTLDTTSITFIEVLGQLSSIKKVSLFDSITSPCTIRAVENGQVIKDPGFSATANPGVDVIFGAYSANKFNRSVSTSAVNDPGIRHTAEWVEFYGAFYNAEALANNISSLIINNIYCYRDRFGPLANATRSPRIAFTTFSSYGSSSWTFSNAAYKRQLVEYAGGTFVYNATSFKTAAAFLDAAKNIDIIIDETYYTEVPTYAQALQAYGATPSDTYPWVTKFFREDGIVTKTYGFDWFTAAQIMKDAVLTDFINVVNSSLPFPGYSRIWIRNVAANEQELVMSADRCDSGQILDLAYSCPTLYAAYESTTASTSSIVATSTASTSSAVSSTASSSTASSSSVSSSSTASTIAGTTAASSSAASVAGSTASTSATSAAASTSASTTGSRTNDAASSFANILMVGIFAMILILSL